jgi:hypothetical protein
VSGNPYPEHGFEHDEQWAEREAEFCDQMAQSMRDNAQVYAAQHTGKKYSSHPSSLGSAYECSIRAAVWSDMAWHLRRPRVARIESRRESNHG